MFNNTPFNIPLYAADLIMSRQPFQVWLLRFVWFDSLPKTTIWKLIARIISISDKFHLSGKVLQEENCFKELFQWGTICSRNFSCIIILFPALDHWYVLSLPWICYKVKYHIGNSCASEEVAIVWHTLCQQQRRTNWNPMQLIMERRLIKSDMHDVCHNEPQRPPLAPLNG